jgi:CDP-diacylglycerol---glycerol-3-phosphate 3-phosphatidyltransferase
VERVCGQGWFRRNGRLAVYCGAAMREMSEKGAAPLAPASVPLRERLRRVAVALSLGVANPLASARDGLARGVIRAGISVNAVTLAGPLAASLVFLPAYLGDQMLAGLVLIVAGAFDVLDGAVARISGRVTAFGGYLDSVVDRFTDFAVLFGLLVHIDRHWAGPQRVLYLALWGLTVVGSSTTAYTRARAETAIPSCKVGFMERPERTLTIIFGLLSGNLHIALWILAVMTNLISIQRILYTRLQLKGREPKSPLWLWTYPRITAPHFALCAIFIVSVILGHHLIPRP